MAENKHTQKFIADKLGLSLYGLRLKLSNKNEFKANELKKIADIYGVSIDYFFSNKVAKIAIKETG